MKPFLFIQIFASLMVLSCDSKPGSSNTKMKESNPDTLNHQNHSTEPDTTGHPPNTLDDDVFIPTCQNPDIVGSGKDTKIETSTDIHVKLGRHGCVPKQSLVLVNDEFCDFTVREGTQNFHYIPYKTVFVHLPDGKTASFSPGYYRSITRGADFWNDQLDICGAISTSDVGVGICALPTGSMIQDASGRYYFESKALIYNSNSVCPSNVICL